MVRPNFLIVGAAKSATSSLDRYIGQHPDVYIPPKKEAHYFSTPDFPPRFEGPGDDGMNTETIRDRDKYLALFAGSEGYKAVGESSVFYLYYPRTAERIHADFPQTKIIMMLRNPVDRAFSAYMHLIRDGREQLSFEDSLAAEEQRLRSGFEPMWFYRELGLYAGQVERYLQVFGPKQVKVVLYDDFAMNPLGTVNEVFEFLGVNTTVSIDTSLHHNESGVPKSRWMYDFISKPNGVKELIKPLIPAMIRERIGMKAKSMTLRREEMNPSTRDQLQQFFVGDVRRLEKLIERDLSRWLERNGGKRL